MISLVEAEQPSLLQNLNSRVVCEMQGLHLAAAPYTMVQDDMALYEFDRAIVNVSLGLAHDLMVDRLISNVKVSKTRTGYATITDDRHHGISAELLAQKWGIGLEKAKATLKCTTQKAI